MKAASCDFKTWDDKDTVREAVRLLYEGWRQCMRNAMSLSAPVSHLGAAAKDLHGPDEDLFEVELAELGSLADREDRLCEIHRPAVQPL